VHQAHPVVTVCLGNDYSVLFDPHGVVFNIKVDPHGTQINKQCHTRDRAITIPAVHPHSAHGSDRTQQQPDLHPHDTAPTTLSDTFSAPGEYRTHTLDSSQSPQVGHTPPREGAETQTPQRPRSGRLGTRHASWSTRVLPTRDLLSLANSNNGKGRVRYTIAQYQLHCMVTGQWGRG